MRVINSLHCWNTGYEDDWPDALRCCDPKSGIVILSGMLEHWYPEFRARMGPEFLIACRLYPEGDWPDGIGRHWNELDPSVWAQECYRRLAAVPGVLDDSYVCVSPNNEPDLRVEGYDVDDTYLTIEQYRFIWNWQAAWMGAMRGLLGGSPVRLGTGPLAGGKDIPGYPPDYEYYLPEFQALAGMADCIWTHGYAQSSNGDQPGNGGYWYALRALRPAGYREQIQQLPPVNGIPDPGGVCTQYPEHTYILAETGTGRHSDLSASYATFLQFQNIYWHHAESRRYALCAPFIWNSGPEHGHNRIQPNHDLWRSLQTMERFDAADWPPVAVPEGGTMPEYIQGFKAYHDAHPEIGAAVSDLMYDANGTAVQYTEKGKLEWARQPNIVYFFAAAG